MSADNQLRVSPAHQSGAAATPLLALVLLVVAVIVFVISSQDNAVDGPKEVIWDKTPCAFCAMHIGDQNFAAQLSTTKGITYFYDDPGCLFLHERTLDPVTETIHQRWFRHMSQPTWLEASEVAFQRCENTPMDFGFGAVPLGTPTAVGLAEATAEVIAK